ncbi:hypothetical protein LguiA_004468 [Lonicera macranthoides]
MANGYFRRGRQDRCSWHFNWKIFMRQDMKDQFPLLISTINSGVDGDGNPDSSHQEDPCEVLRERLVEQLHALIA